MITVMKKNIIYTALLAIVFIAASCEDYFLQKPLSNDLTAAEVFSSKEKAMSAISQAYSDAIRINITCGDDNSRTYGMVSGTLAHISGELNGFRYNWSDPVAISSSGMSATGNYRIDNFNFNYTAIRRCYTVIENIGSVPDMTEEEKKNVIGEMYALIAYRYCRMMIQYGGVPIVKGIVPFDQKESKRSTVQEVLDHVIDLCDNQAYPRMVDRHPDDMKGRLTKGAALCIKAQAYLYCARPLFNTNKPYISLGGENDKLLCMGEPYNDQLWKDARDACKAVIKWAESNGHKIIDTDDPFNDYGRAVAAPDSEEIIVSWQAFYAKHYDPRQQGGGANNMSYTQLKHYYKQDGTEQEWPENLPAEQWAAVSDYTTRIEQMEARYWASAVPGGYDARNNEGYNAWKANSMCNYGNWEGRANVEQCGRRCKFWYHAGDRTWFNYPIYRLAYFYLALAEAENELGNYKDALEALNVTRNRAGLPDVTETDKDKLRTAIQREWAVEFYEENHRLFDVKHWKHKDLGNGIIGGEKKAFRFQYNAASSGSYALSNYKGYKVDVFYKGFWADNQYLNPFPAGEVNKGYLVQNPGY